MLEIHITIPGLVEGLNAIADAIRKAPAPIAHIPVPEMLLQPTSPEPPATTKGRKKNVAAVVETPPQGDLPVINKLADPESVRSEMRELMGKAMAIDLKNGNKEHRTTIQGILREVHAESDGKISGIPEEKLEEAAEKIRTFVEGLGE